MEFNSEELYLIAKCVEKYADEASYMDGVPSNVKNEIPMCESIVKRIKEAIYTTTYEYCPHCASEVELKHEMTVQQCPNCGMWICPCSICEGCHPKCEIENECKKLNRI